MSDRSDPDVCGSAFVPPMTETPELLRLKNIMQEIVDRIDSGAQNDEPITITNGDLCRWYDQLEIVHVQSRTPARPERVCDHLGGERAGWEGRTILRLSRELVLDIPDDHIDLAIRILREEIHSSDGSESSAEKKINPDPTALSLQQGLATSSNPKGPDAAAVAKPEMTAGTVHPACVSSGPSDASLIAHQENSLRTQPEPVADGEAVAWRVRVRVGSMTRYAYTERLPFEPLEGSDTVVLRDPEPLYASPPPARAGVGDALARADEADWEWLLIRLDRSARGANWRNIIHAIRRALAQPSWEKS